MRDHIATSIDISASLERVWDLVSEPGWWINTGTLGGHRVEHRGTECTVTDDELGEFLVGILVTEPLERAVFTWQPGGDDVPRTTVEFTLTPLDADTVRVSVVESGFSQMSAEQHGRNFRANVSGWEEELHLALVHTESRSDAGHP